MAASALTFQATEPLLLALALALVDQPRASLQQLATAVGVSKATLYRFCPTRDALVDRLFSESARQFSYAFAKADLLHSPVRQGFRALVEAHMQHKELFIFLIYHWRPEFLAASNSDSPWLGFQRQLDQFFLRAQQQGELRIDVSAAAMSEMFMGMLLSLIDAERMGRVARTELLHSMEQLFFQGANRPATH